MSAPEIKKEPLVMSVDEFNALDEIHQALAVILQRKGRAQIIPNAEASHV